MSSELSGNSNISCLVLKPIEYGDNKEKLLAGHLSIKALECGNIVNSNVLDGHDSSNKRFVTAALH